VLDVGQDPGGLGPGLDGGQGQLVEAPFDGDGHRRPGALGPGHSGQPFPPFGR
jgi:hypothetical protein